MAQKKKQSRCYNVKDNIVLAFNFFIFIICMHLVPMVQLDNTSPSEGEDCGFESRWARQKRTATWRFCYFSKLDFSGNFFARKSALLLRMASVDNTVSFMQNNGGFIRSIPSATASTQYIEEFLHER